MWVSNLWWIKTDQQQELLSPWVDLAVQYLKGTILWHGHTWRGNMIEITWDPSLAIPIG